MGQEPARRIDRSPEAGLRLKACLGMRVSAQPLTPELVHMAHISAQCTVITAVAAEAAASV